MNEQTAKPVRTKKVEAFTPDDPKRKGRPKSNNYLPFEEAREVVRNELLHSRGAFETWHEREKPKTIPRFPYRVFIKEWVSWNDFLGTNNEFKSGSRTWRPYKEAIHFAHTLQLKTQKDWLDYCRENKETFPADIPRRPDVVYDQWVSWNHWLGGKVVEAVQAKLMLLQRQCITLFTNKTSLATY